MKFKRFKLNALSAEGLRQKEMDAIVGGTHVVVVVHIQKMAVPLLMTTRMLTMVMVTSLIIHVILW